MIRKWSSQKKWRLDVTATIRLRTIVTEEKEDFQSVQPQKLGCGMWG